MFKFGGFVFADVDGLGHGEGHVDGEAAVGADGDGFDEMFGDDVLFVDAEKGFWVEGLDDGVEGAAIGVFGAGVCDEYGFFGGGVEADDAGEGDGNEAVVDGDEQFFGIGVGIEAVYCVEVVFEGAAGEFFVFVEGSTDFVGGEGFEQVVDAVDFEGFEGVFVVGGGEDDGDIDGGVVENVEGGAVGEVYVHKYEVGQVGGLLEVVEGLADALGVADDFDLGVDFGKNSSEVEVCGGFVFYY